MARARKAKSNNYVGIVSSLAVLLIIALPFFLIFFSNNSRTRAGAAGSTFQPTAPYYATYFYPWSQNPNTDSN